MRGDVLSRRYAGALADVVEKDGQLERVRGELSALADALSASGGFRIMTMTAAQSREEKKAAFARICDALGLSAHIARLLQYLVQRRRASLLPLLAQSFAEEADRRLGVRRAFVTSAVPLSEAQRGRIVESLEGLTRARIELQEAVDESLIAGFQVRLDGMFFDGSLAGRLDRIRETMAHGG
ncbi:MAG: ATP synthase F1 subunit delta [Candidatus Brocadiae bacterium]|nr:ATP synthase F1 subunit delta [Candidatus Brocadiia bacterium]